MTSKKQISVEKQMRSLRMAASAVERHKIIPVIAGTILDVLDATPANEARVAIKKLDLSNILKHAFLSGVVAAREIPGHEECDGLALWTRYEPYEPGSLARIRSALDQPAR